MTWKNQKTYDARAFPKYSLNVLISRLARNSKQLNLCVCGILSGQNDSARRLSNLTVCASLQIRLLLGWAHSNASVHLVNCFLGQWHSPAQLRCYLAYFVHITFTTLQPNCRSQHSLQKKTWDQFFDCRLFLVRQWRVSGMLRMIFWPNLCDILTTYDQKWQKV